MICQIGFLVVHLQQKVFNGLFMTKTKDYSFGTIRLKHDTVDFLKDMKEAFEASYGKKFTMDEFVHQMAASVEAGDPGVWDVFCTMQNQKDELQAKVEASQKLRERLNKRK